MYYLFYDDRLGKKDCIMGLSTEKTAMEFPYIKTKTWYNVLQHLEIVTDENGKKKIKVKVVSMDDPNNILTQ